MRTKFLVVAYLLIVVNLLGYFYLPQILWSLVIVAPVLLLGFIDFFQTRQAIRRNYPILGRVRYMFEKIRPEINQYFVESNSSGRPFSREKRSVVYQRAKGELDTLPFGTQMDVYAPGYEWMHHSLAPTHLDPKSLRVQVGGPDCKQPYNASVFNISAMSFGSLSRNAILALNGGARDGNFAHNTGEGGLSPYHLNPGGDVIWQIGTGYFGCRDEDGNFNDDSFEKRATSETVKMIEIKLSQGAKPGHGGILPGRKVTAEIAEIRHVPLGKDVISPPAHKEFNNPLGLLSFVVRLRKLSGGKPVGFKLCVGKRHEFLAICKAMIKTGITPDYIAVDGGEGGTGAAPLEFSNRIGTPGVEGLVFVHNALVGFGLRERIRVIAAGKVTTSFDIAKRIAIGADIVYSARAMMMALGCIQAIRCNANDCPTGVATQNPQLMVGLDVADKRKRVARFHEETMDELAHLLGAIGLESTAGLRPRHVMRRTSMNVVTDYGHLFHFIPEKCLLGNTPPTEYVRDLAASVPESFVSALKR